MSPADIVQKIWNYCHVLCDDWMNNIFRKFCFRNTPFTFINRVVNRFYNKAFYPDFQYYRLKNSIKIVKSSFKFE